MQMIYHFLFCCLVASTLRGVCFGSQEDALKKYDDLVEELAFAQDAGDYARVADLIINQIGELRSSFGTKNLAEMKRECQLAPNASMQEIFKDFITKSLLPKNADAVLRKKALDLLKNLLSTRIITLDSQKEAIAAARALLEIGLWEAIELAYSPIVLFSKITTKDDQNALFETIFLPLIEQYGPVFAVKSPAAPGYEQFERVMNSLLTYHPPLMTLKDAQGKTAIHRLFEKNLGSSVVQPQAVQSDKYLRELTPLASLAGLAEAPVVRTLSKGAKAADWILDLGHEIRTMQDNDANTFLHTLRKNNIFSAQDADVRDLLERDFGIVDFMKGFSRTHFMPIFNKEGKRYTDYPPSVEPGLYKAYLDRYTAHALNQFADSLTALI